jgi:hypothetical protein
MTPTMIDRCLGISAARRASPVTDHTDLWVYGRLPTPINVGVVCHHM